MGGYRNPAYYGSPSPSSKYSSPMDSHHFFTMRPGQCESSHEYKYFRLQFWGYFLSANSSSHVSEPISPRAFLIYNYMCSLSFQSRLNFYPSTKMVITMVRSMERSFLPSSSSITSHFSSSHDD